LDDAFKLDLLWRRHLAGGFPNRERGEKTAGKMSAPQKCFF
jgi:hypothetical protein